MGEFWHHLTSYPVVLFSLPFAILAVVMLLDLLFDLSDGGLGDTDAGQVEASWVTNFYLPPILSKVPLPVALCIAFFLAMVAMFYIETELLSLLSGLLRHGLTVGLLPIVLYLSLLTTSWLIKPLAPLFDHNNSFAAMEFEGMRGQVRSNEVSDEFGEVVIVKDGNEVQLDVFQQGSLPIAYGDEVVILAKDAAKNRYLVSKI